MKNEEWLREPKAAPSSSYAEVKPAILHSSFHIHFFIIVYCILFYCFYGRDQQGDDFAAIFSHTVKLSF